MENSIKQLVHLQNLEFRANGSRRKLTEIAHLRSDIAEQILRKYDTRKRRYGARSVVPIEGVVCSGCQMALSLGTRRRAHQQLTECEHCARLLYNPTRIQRIRAEIV
jgi:predicted  nucleic acid-binding Zn-ribbon protein